MSRILRMRDGSSIDLVGIAVIAAVCLTIAFLAMQIAPIVSLYKHPPQEVAATRNDGEAVQKHADSLAWDRDQVRGRSLFFVPLKPDEKPVVTETAKRYEGPSLSMFINGTAYFSDGQKVSAAEPEGKSIRFISSSPPWSVRVRWRGGEFDVPIFEKTQLSSLTSTLSGTFPSSGWSGKSSTTPAPSSTDGHAAPHDTRPAATEVPPPPPPMVSGGSEPAPAAPGATPPPPPNPPGDPAPVPASPSNGGSPGASSPPPAAPSPSTPPPSPTEPQKESVSQTGLNR